MEICPPATVTSSTDGDKYLNSVRVGDRLIGFLNCKADTSTTSLRMVAFEMNNSGCHSDCNGCSVPSDATKCVACSDPNKLIYNGSCYSTCPVGTKKTVFNSCKSLTQCPNADDYDSCINTD